MNRRKTVSVTPAMGASTVAGEIRTDPIWTESGTRVGRTLFSDNIWGRSGVLSQNFFTPIFYLPDKLAPMPMPLPYNRIAGQSIERLAALSDGVFAVAMTLLILDVHVPIEARNSEHDLWMALLALGPRFLVYAMSFLTLGIFWNGQQTQLSRFSRSDRDLTWIHIAFLAGASVTPFSTALLENFIHLRVALLVYWANIVFLGGVLYGSWHHAIRAGLLKEDVTHEIRCAVERRILVAQALYAVGFALCVFSTYWSIVAIVLLQLNFAIAPRIPWLKRI